MGRQLRSNKIVHQIWQKRADRKEWTAGTKERDPSSSFNKLPRAWVNVRMHKLLDMDKIRLKHLAMDGKCVRSVQGFLVFCSLGERSNRPIPRVIVGRVRAKKLSVRVAELLELKTRSWLCLYQDVLQPVPI